MPTMEEIKTALGKMGKSTEKPLIETSNILNENINPNPFSEKLFAPVEKLENKIQSKDKIIEELKNETLKLKNKVSQVEEEKSTILEELNKARWLENKVTLATKKVYEDKVKSVINENVDSKIIPILTAVARKKQGNQQLNWGKWLKIPENRYLYELNQDIAKKIFEDTDALIPKRRTRGGGDVAKNYILSFTGDTNVATRRGDLVATDFNPDNPDGSGKPLAESGFTISYWVRPDELGADMFAIGRKAHNNSRFTFGISRKNKGYFGVGANQSERAWATMLDTAGMDKSTHLVQDTDDEWILVVGRWYHFAVTYAGANAGNNNRLRKIYMNGQQIWGTGVSDPTYKGNIAWSQTGTEMNKGLSFGMRAVRGSGTSTSYNNGWACGLDEVAIYNEEKDADFIAAVYNGGTNYDHTGASKLVGYWKFNEGSGTRVEDLSGNGNHGLLTNDSHGDDGGAAFASGTPTWQVGNLGD